MDKWVEIRTAYHLAELGSVSATSRLLGLHRATIVRHIESLEAELGEKLFQRHSLGYHPTDVGQDLLQVGRNADEQFSQLVGRVKNRAAKISGELIITSHDHIAPLVLPALARFQNKNPETVISYKANADVIKLEYGTAHVAIRAGSKPDDDDYVVSAFRELRFGLYAHRNYVAKFGLPKNKSDFKDHKFVHWDIRSLNLPNSNWFENVAEEEQIAMSTQDLRIAEQSVVLGMGIGLFSDFDANNTVGLVNLIPPSSNWSIQLWAVTHVDLHRTPKVQQFLKTLREGSST